MKAYRNYVVKEGDSWYKIALAQLGDGSKYKELIKINGKELKIGAEIKIPV